MARPPKYKHCLPWPVYNQTVWLIRDYYRLKDELDSIIGGGSGGADGQQRGNGIGNPTMAKAIKRAELKQKIDAIETARAAIPEEYRQGVWDNILYGCAYPIYAGVATYSRHKRNFLGAVARLAHIL